MSKKEVSSVDPNKIFCLSVGINRYPECPLQGCVNDVSNFTSYLMNFVHVPPENIRMLCDERATKEAWIERLDWLKSVTPKDGVAVHQYSGHGTQFPTRDYAGEIDNLLEVVCPYDFSWEPEHMIADKEFVRIFRDFHCPVWWISDSCCSGDLSRGIFNPPAPTNPSHKNYRKPRAYPIPFDIQHRLITARVNGVQQKALTEVRARGMVCGELNVGYISGCKSDETSADAYLEGSYQGALTAHFLKALMEYPDASLVRLAARTTQLLRKNGFTQSPQAEGARKKKKFFG